MNWTPPQPDANGPCCPVCAISQVYAPMERWGGVWRCDCGFEQPDDMTQDADRYERELAEEIARHEEARQIWHDEIRIPIKHTGGSNGRRRKRVPKADERVMPKANAEGQCWRCGVGIGYDGRRRYCGECGAEAARESATERKRREREKTNESNACA